MTSELKESLSRQYLAIKYAPLMSVGKIALIATAVIVFILLMWAWNEALFARDLKLFIS